MTKRVFGLRRSLLVPVSHAEYEWQVRGPRVNSDVSWYFGIDGKAKFRTMDTLDQAWVLGPYAHEYREPDAVEVTRLVGKMLIAHVHQHLRRPDLPFGGYYPLGVCQDSVAAIERKMTGQVTLFPNTADGVLWDDPRDGETNEMMLAIPKDRSGSPPAPTRIFGSLLTTDLQTITIFGLTADLEAAHAAWQDGADGSLERTRSWIGGDDVAADWWGCAGRAGGYCGVETPASQEMIVAADCSRCNSFAGSRLPIREGE